MTPLERYTRALERLRAAVEAAMGRHAAPAPRTRKKSRVAKAKPVRRTKRAQRPAQAVVPPRTEPDVRELVETFAPPPTPPGPISPVMWVPPASPPRSQAAMASVESDEARIIRVVAEAGPRPAPAPVPVATGPARGQCTAISAHTGRRCGLLEGHGGSHVHGRTAFDWVAAPGQTLFARDVELAEAAQLRQPTGTPYETRNGAQERQWYRRQAAARAQQQTQEGV